MIEKLEKLDFWYFIQVMSILIIIKRYKPTEIWDLRKGISVWEDTKSDMEANNLGQAYGWELYKKYHPVRAAIRSLD